MMIKRAVYLAAFLLISLGAKAQVNIYVGGSLQGNYSWIRGVDNSMEPGFGGGFSFVYWEYEYWFLKVGLDYHHKSSTITDYPDIFGVAPEGPDDKIDISYVEQTIGVPLTIYFRPYEAGPNSILITGSLTTAAVAHLKGTSEEYGETVLKGTDVKNRIKTNLGIGVGYQRQLDRHMFLNIFPSYNLDLRADQSFRSLNLTAELIFGVY